MIHKIEISRELAENIAAYMEGSASPTVEQWHRELRALLAAPVVERQEPVAYLYQYSTVTTCEGHKGWREEIERERPPQWMIDEGKVTGLTPLYAEQPAPMACTSCDGSGEYIDAIGDWRGYCSCPAGVALKNKPAPVAVLPSLWEIRVRDEPDNPESPCEYVYVSSAAERDSILRRGGASVFAEYACLDKVKELNP